MNQKKKRMKSSFNYFLFLDNKWYNLLGGVYGRF